MAAIFALAIRAFEGSVMRPLREALVDWPRNKGRHEVSRSIAWTTAKRHMIPSRHGTTFSPRPESPARRRIAMRSRAEQLYFGTEESLTRIATRSSFGRRSVILGLCKSYRL